mgnify:CR=1 FL=1
MTAPATYRWFALTKTQRRVLLTLPDGWQPRNDQQVMPATRKVLVRLGLLEVERSSGRLMYRLTEFGGEVREAGKEGTT